MFICIIIIMIIISCIIIINNIIGSRGCSPGAARRCRCLQTIYIYIYREREREGYSLSLSYLFMCVSYMPKQLLPAYLTILACILNFLHAYMSWEKRWLDLLWFNTLCYEVGYGIWDPRLDILRIDIRRLDIVLVCLECRCTYPGHVGSRPCVPTQDTLARVLSRHVSFTAIDATWNACAAEAK